VKNTLRLIGNRTYAGKASYQYGQFGMKSAMSSGYTVLKREMTNVGAKIRCTIRPVMEFRAAPMTTLSRNLVNECMGSKRWACWKKELEKNSFVWTMAYDSRIITTVLVNAVFPLIKFGIGSGRCNFTCRSTQYTKAGIRSMLMIKRTMLIGCLITVILVFMFLHTKCVSESATRAENLRENTGKHCQRPTSNTSFSPLNIGSFSIRDYSNNPILHPTVWVNTVSHGYLSSITGDKRISKFVRVPSFRNLELIYYKTHVKCLEYHCLEARGLLHLTEFTRILWTVHI